MRSRSADCLNESDAYLAIGAIQRRQGKWADSSANLEKAANLNPKDTWPLQNLAMNYQMLRNFDAANRTVDRALQINPQAVGLWEIKGKLALGEKGDFGMCEQVLEKVKSFPMSDEERLMIVGGEASFLLLQREYQQLLQLGQQFKDDLFAAVPGSLALKYFSIGVAQKALSDAAAARTAFLKAKEILEEQVKQRPDDAYLHVQLAKSWRGLAKKMLPSPKRNELWICDRKAKTHSKVRRLPNRPRRFMPSLGTTLARSSCWMDY